MVCACIIIDNCKSNLFIGKTHGPIVGRNRLIRISHWLINSTSTYEEVSTISREVANWFYSTISINISNDRSMEFTHMAILHTVRSHWSLCVLVCWQMDIPQMKQIKWYNNPWWESIFDTFIGTLINFPLNIVLLWSAQQMQLSILQTSTYLCVVFVVLAIVRKTIIRKFFNKKSCILSD